MLRSAFAPALAVIFCAATASAAFAQVAKTAASTSGAAQAPAARAKWVAPVKGVATIEVIRSNPKQVGKEVWTVLKIKNTSPGAIALLRADEYWYDTSRKMVTGDTQRWRQPLNPGEIIEITMKSPAKPNLTQSQINFAHANGTIQAKGVKKF
jgi:hypothetical protein